ncbi:LacI family transcriptional regulator [Asanoa hainanensis]|uniref:LacI family transcriptional regulator n=1 Tax=Asanoa hainanensis TaxID=560556 RepID=A0A239PFT6_9ACTN|nr:LacI family transcriptional regulator [Asanoa hainanensis]
MTASIKDVAHLAGVFIGTVSNVLNRPETVMPRTRRKVLDAITELGYVRNDSARQLRAGRSRTIAIVVLDVSNPFFTDVVRAAEVVIEDAGQMLVVCNSGEEPERELRHLDSLEEQRVQGVLVTPISDGPSPRIDTLVARGIPVVLVDRTSAHPSRCSVAVDDVAGGRLAADHLVERGHRHIAFVGGPFGMSQVKDRHAGAATLVNEHGGKVRLSVHRTGTLSVVAGRQAADDLVALPAAQRPSAAFCGNDLVALGLLQGLAAHGVRVPEDNGHRRLRRHRLRRGGDRATQLGASAARAARAHSRAAAAGGVPQQP